MQREKARIGKSHGEKMITNEREGDVEGVQEEKNNAMKGMTWRLRFEERGVEKVIGPKRMGRKCRNTPSHIYQG